VGQEVAALQRTLALKSRIAREHNWTGTDGSARPVLSKIIRISVGVWTPWTTWTAFRFLSRSLLVLAAELILRMRKNQRIFSNYPHAPFRIFTHERPGPTLCDRHVNYGLYGEFFES
jgi:hypothetical protein